jgi:MraZ protein
MASQPFRYSGPGFSLQRDKGRFVLPAPFRKTIRESSENRPTLCLAAHDRWRCLIGFGLSRAEDFEAQLDREADDAARQNREFDRELRAAQLNNFIEVPFDDSGRFVLPQYLGDPAGIGEEIYFQGGGGNFLLFAPDELYKMGAGFEGFQAACRHMQAVETAKAKKS